MHCESERKLAVPWTMSWLSALALATSQSERSLSKLDAPWNMPCRVVAALTSQPERSLLKAVTPPGAKPRLNTMFMRVTRLTSHIEMSLLKLVACMNVPCISVTAETSQQEMSSSKFCLSQNMPYSTSW